MELLLLIPKLETTALTAADLTPIPAGLWDTWYLFPFHNLLLQHQTFVRALLLRDKENTHFVEHLYLKWVHCTKSLCACGSISIPHYNNIYDGIRAWLFSVLVIFFLSVLIPMEFTNVHYFFLPGALTN